MQLQNKLSFLFEKNQTYELLNCYLLVHVIKAIKTWCTSWNSNTLGRHHTMVAITFHILTDLMVFLYNCLLKLTILNNAKCSTQCTEVYWGIFLKQNLFTVFIYLCLTHKFWGKFKRQRLFRCRTVQLFDWINFRIKSLLIDIHNKRIYSN